MQTIHLWAQSALYTNVRLTYKWHQQTKWNTKSCVGVEIGECVHWPQSFRCKHLVPGHQTQVRQHNIWRRWGRLDFLWSGGLAVYTRPNYFYAYEIICTTNVVYRCVIDVSNHAGNHVVSAPRLPYITRLIDRRVAQRPFVSLETVDITRSLDVCYHDNRSQQTPGRRPICSARAGCEQSQNIWRPPQHWKLYSCNARSTSVVDISTKWTF